MTGEFDPFAVGTAPSFSEGEFEKCCRWDERATSRKAQPCTHRSPRGLTSRKALLREPSRCGRLAHGISARGLEDVGGHCGKCLIAVCCLQRHAGLIERLRIRRWLSIDSPTLRLLITARTTRELSRRTGTGSPNRLFPLCSIADLRLHDIEATMAWAAKQKHLRHERTISARA